MQYALNNEYIWKEISNQVVILHLDSGKYYSLNEVGSLIWKGILDHMSLDDIVDRICSDYDVEEKSARNDAEEMVRNFQQKKFIKSMIF